MNTLELYELLKPEYEKTARFRKAVLHVHTIASHDWADRDNADPAANEKSQFEGEAGRKNFLSKLKGNYEIVGITDHMKCEYGCDLANIAESHEMLVIPGMEVTCTLPTVPGQIHVNVFFPPGSDVGLFERLFSDVRGFPTEDRRDGKESVEINDLREFIEAVRIEGGMVVLAHYNSNRGHRHVLREGIENASRSFETDSITNRELQAEVADQYAKVLANTCPTAVEIQKYEDKQHLVKLTYDGGEISVPSIMRSDFHCVEDFNQTELTTYIKVPDLGYESVKAAFKFSQTRIRFEKDKPEKPCPRIVGFQLVVPNECKQFMNMKMAFADNLTCMIGPRGSGKSTIIEALRTVLGAQQSLNDWSEDGPRQVAKKISQENLAGLILRVLYIKPTGEMFQLEVSPSGDDAIGAIEVYDKDGKEVDVAQEHIAEEFPCRIYSWSQLESLGRSPFEQRSVLDSFDNDIIRLKAELDDKLRHLKTGRGQLSAIVEELTELLEKESGSLRKYSQHKSAFNNLNTTEMNAMFSRVDSSEERITTLKLVRASLTETITMLEGLEVDPSTSIDELVEELDSDEIRDWLKGRLATYPQFQTKFAAFSEAQEEYQAELLLQSDAVDKDIEQQETELELARTEIREQVANVSEVEIDSKQRAEAKLRFDSTKVIRDEYLQKIDSLKIAIEERRSDCSGIRKLRSDVRAKRESECQETMGRLSPILPDELKVNILVQGEPDNESYKEWLVSSNLINRDNAGQFNKSAFADRLAHMLDPMRFGDILIDGSEEDFGKYGQSINDDASLDDAEVAKLYPLLKCLTHNDDADVDVFDADLFDQALELHEQEFDDTVEISINGKPIEDVSPGQRCSALLPLVALAETCPLVIDQPEDNLDNRLIGNVMMRVLANLKEHRQIIIATHNANLVVGGDAEQVVILDPDGVCCEVSHCGSIDSPPIVESVISIMEGGKEAFAARQRRYAPAE